MSRATAICCVMIGTGCVSLALASAIRPLPLVRSARAASTDVYDAEQKRLQQLADKSCRCERRTGINGKKACWAAFDAQLPQTDSNEQFTSCLPIPQTQRCKQNDTPAGDDDGLLSSGPCATIEYRYEGSDGEVLLCSKDEATAVERLWNREVSANPRPNVRTPMADKLAHDLVAGKPIPTTSGLGGCAAS